MKQYVPYILIYGVIYSGLFSRPGAGGKLIYSDDFSVNNLTENWVIEENGKEEKVCQVRNGMMELNSDGGVTVWYKQKLQGNILIEYDRKVIMEGGVHDRLSDLNQFWMATDPSNQMFTRKGGFREYDSLKMYYVGMGGNYNATTRFRRYDGNGKLEIIGEYTDSTHLLTANRTYHIAISCKDGAVTFKVDNKVFFSYMDKMPLANGWFAIRSTRSRQVIDNIKIWQLE